MNSGDQATRFRPATRRRNRIAAGVALGALAVAVNVWIYSNLNTTESVLQAVRDIPAGEQITADAVRAVDADVDSSVGVIAATDIGSVIGQYATVRLVSGSLITSYSLQPEPLVAPGSSVVALLVAEGSLPIGLRERSPVQVVIPTRDGADATAPVVVSGRVVGLPSEATTVTGQLSLSVEVPSTDAPIVAAADDVRIVVTEPTADPASEGGS